jgi:gas vesicle protein
VIASYMVRALVVVVLGTMVRRGVPMTEKHIRALASLLTGLGLGVAVGALCAPRSGPATRHLIQRKVKQTADLLKTRVEEGAEYVRHRTAEARDQASDLIDEGKQALRNQISQFARDVSHAAR